jgi:shikimate kinase
MPLIVLIGPPGSGKTSVGKALGKLLDLPVRDTDAIVESIEGKSISDIFLEDGETKFREVEQNVVLGELERTEGILSLGGGSVLDPKVQEKLLNSSALVAFLDVGISNAAPRVGFNRDRPLLTVNPRQQWIALMEVRRPIYERLAWRKFSTDDLKPMEVAKSIISEMDAGK